jgi:hypothetical protein
VIPTVEVNDSSAIPFYLAARHSIPDFNSLGKGKKPPAFISQMAWPRQMILDEAQASEAGLEATGPNGRYQGSIVSGLRLRPRREDLG